MDFELEILGPAADMTFYKTTTILNNLYFSIMVERGSFFQNPDFGMRSVARMKNTPRTEALIKEYAKEACQWIIDTGKATKIEFETERDRRQDLGRIKLLVTATQADSREVTFETFKTVI